MRSRRRVTGPQALIGLLVVLCALIAAISIAMTSGSSGPPLSAGNVPTLDRSKLTKLHPRDGVPSLDSPGHESVASVDWLDPLEPVVAVEVGKDARAYPLRILMWHEIVNDRIGVERIAVTYCPLCNTAVTFRRPEIEGRITTFGTSGSLYRSNLLMYDRASASLWPQLTGIAIHGEVAGSHLLRIPSPIVSWRSFRTAFPDASVLSRDTGFDRPYGKNPHPGYDTESAPPFDVRVEIDDRLRAKERVLGARADGEVVAYPFSRLEQAAGEDGLTVVNETIGAEPVVVVWSAGTVSALDDKNIVDSRDVGSAVVYSRRIDRKTLEFEARGERVVDRATGSTWNIFGTATRGPRRGTQLRTIDTIEAFWFNWAAFHPKTSVWSGS